MGNGNAHILSSLRSSHFGIPGPILGESQGAVGDTRSLAPSDYSVKIMIWATIMMMMMLMRWMKTIIILLIMMIHH